jgi:DNA-binding GntR family transcriptional regulator
MLIACVALEHESLMQTALIHVPIVEALQTRDIARSVAAMECHIKATWAEVLRVYEEIEFLTSGAERASA